MVKGLYIMGREAFNRVYSPQIRADIEGLVTIDAPLVTQDEIKANMTLLNDVEVIFSGWGGPKLDQTFLDAAPHLKAFFYAAGSVKSIVTDEVWKRGITLSSAYAANAIPVAEYTLSQILFSLKNGWRYALDIKNNQKYVRKDSNAIPGVYERTVGIISLGMVGRRVCELLKPFDIKIIAYDPFVTKEEAEKLGVSLCSLEDIFREADVVSLHAPWLKETENLITGEHFKALKPSATFINTARGAIVNEAEMVTVLKERQDILAILDVTYPEPPKEGSLLFSLPNIILTPHIAGSEGRECERLARYMVDELKRYLNGESLQWHITEKKFSILA